MANFRPNILPNLADSCLFRRNETHSEWLFETPSPYPSNLKCKQTVQCPNHRFIHYRFNRLKIGTPDEGLADYKGTWLPPEQQ